MGFKVKFWGVRGSDSSDASRVGRKAPFLPGGIHKSGSGLFVGLDCCSDNVTRCDSSPSKATLRPRDRACKDRWTSTPVGEQCDGDHQLLGLANLG